MTTVQDFTAAIEGFFDELDQVAIAEWSGQSAALIGALDPFLSDASGPLEAFRDAITSAVAGLTVPDDSDLATEIVGAIMAAMPDGITAALDGDAVILTINGTRTTDIPGTADLDLSQTTGLGLDLSGVLDLSATAQMDLALRFSTAAPNGVLSVEDDSAMEDVQLSLGATLNEDSLSDTLSLGLVQGSAALGEGLNGTQLAVALDLDGDALGALDPDATTSAEARLAVDLDVGFVSDFLPSLGGTLVLDFTTGAEDDPLGLLSGVSVEDLSLSVDALDHLLNRILGPLDNIVSAFPLGPVINLLTAPLPIVNTLAKGLDQEPDGRVTLNDLLAYFSGGNYDPTFVSVIGQIASVLDTIDDLSSSGGVSLGSINLSSGALTALADGEGGGGLSDVFEFPALDTSIFDAVAGDLLADLSTFDTGGLSFPLLGESAPLLAAQILFSDFLDTPVPLVEFILPEFGLSREQASFEVTIPVGPFAAVIEGGFEAAFRIGAGISTRGLTDGEAAFGNSLYLTTPLSDGERLPLAEFTADLGAG
ncbi:MAG: hypothetical protein HRU30_07480, partial [Rhodobacteraceae bacterium]|nr:hypothetical protein [Paracoccaceae bacterium]